MKISILLCQVSVFLTVAFIFQEKDKAYVFVGAAFEGLNDGFKLQKIACMYRIYFSSATVFLKNKNSIF